MSAGVTTANRHAAILAALDPSSVVVIGASPQGRGFTAAPLKNLRRHGYRGEVYAVNPKYDEIDGVPCFSSVADLPIVPEAAVLVVGARRVPAALRECADAGVRVATVIAGGFAELGAEGVRLENEVREIIAGSALRMHGPNTAGLMSVSSAYVPRAALNHPDDLRTGGFAIVTQSGALCNTLTNRVLARGLGITHAIATGSQWDLDQWDFTDYLIDREDVAAVATIVEGIEDARKALAVVERGAAAGKPVIVLKPGVSELGANAVRTHSGALSGDSEVELAVLADHGAIVVNTIDELWECAQLFDAWRGATVGDGGLAIATYSGGDGALAVDEADRMNLRCATLSEATVAKLDGMYTLATAANPFDFTGEVVDRPELIEPTVESLLTDPQVGALLVAAPVWSGHFARWIVGPAVEAAARQKNVPVAVSLWSAGDVTAEAEAMVRDAGLPLFDGSPGAVRAIARYDRWHRERSDFRRASDTTAPPLTSEPRVARILGYGESREILAEADLPFNIAETVGNRESLERVLDEIGLPVTLKASAPSIVHKAAAGAVRLCIPSRAEAMRAFDELVALAPDVEVTVEQYVPSTAMLFVGGRRSASFGPVLIVGLGGGYAEAFHDVAHAEAPLTAEQALRALATTKVYRSIESNATAVGAITDLLVRVSGWFAQRDRVESFDLNPVLVSIDGHLTAVDARVEVV